MLAAHRDQENLVHSQQVPTKQAPKTPGSRYPKTPSGFGRRDENATGGFGGKGAVGDGRLLVKGLGVHQNAITPMAPQNRAVLGDKTTNAKARTGPGRTGGPDDFDKNQARPSSVRNSRQKPAGSRKLFISTQRVVGPEHDEPEYAPPRPKDLPYQSDVLPNGGLSFEGVKQQNLFKGFYQHFHDPADDRGVTRLDRLLAEDMAAVLEDAIQCNMEETDQLAWNVADMDPEDTTGWKEEARQPGARLAGKTSQRRVPSISSRHAADALAAQAPTRNRSGARIPPSAASDRAMGSASNNQFGTSVGEAASRTSIGYTRGRSTSSVLHPRREAGHSRPNRVKRIVPIISSDDPDSTTTTTTTTEHEHERSAVFDGEGAEEEGSCPRPAFLSIFDGHLDEEDLPAMPTPFEDSGDESDFEMRLEI